MARKEGSMERRVVLATLVALGTMLGTIGWPAWAGVPTDQLRDVTARVLKVLDTGGAAAGGQSDDRRRRVRAIADEVFDWPEAAKRALGRHWGERTDPERQEFARLFADLIERNWIGRIEQYSGEQVRFFAEEADGDRVTVRSLLVNSSGTEIPIDYRMVRHGERWRVYDVVVEGVSLVGNYRTQFDRIVRQSGYPALVNKLRTKHEEFAPRDSTGGRRAR
jgi:phospholipid transport system substrate-binding protein